MHYLRMFYYFGPIFCFDKEAKRYGFIRTVSQGVQVTKLVSVTMEALMRTIVEIGCAETWPRYMDSDAYKDWKNGTGGGGNKPVSSCQ